MKRLTGATATRGREDAGLTLIEVLVAQAVLGVFMILFTAAAQQMFGTTNRTESLSTAQSQLQIALQRLDKEIRYASVIDPAGQVGDTWYVEYLTTVSGQPTCTGLKLADGKLWRAAWPQSADRPSLTWLPLASGVAAGPDQKQDPFQTLASDPDVGVRHSRLRLHLSVAAGAGADAATAETNITFTAVNSSVQTLKDDVFAPGGGPASPVTPRSCPNGRPTT